MHVVHPVHLEGMIMIRTFDKDYRYLLANLIPRHRLSPERRRHIKDALASGDDAAIRLAAVLALEDLYQAEYFDRSRTQDENGYVILTYGRSNGSYQIRVTVPVDEWTTVDTESAGTVSPTAKKIPTEVTVPEAEAVETTINVLPDILRSFSINGERESMLQRLDTVTKLMPDWFRFTWCRLVLVDERVPDREGHGEFVTTRSEQSIRDTGVYQRCREGGETAILDANGAVRAGLAPPWAEDSDRTDREDAHLGVAPVFSLGEFWGVLEVWIRGQDNGPLFKNRVEIASGMVEQIIENTLRLENLTSIDKLTGIYNRQFYDRQVRIEMERATRSGTKLSLLVLDIDDFKKINDTLGHRKGDEALAVVADVIRENLRKIDIPFRYGGEEFVILLPGTPEMEAIHTAERLRTVISEFERFVDEEGSKWVITVSIGAAVFPDHARTENELFSRADTALYIAKRKGKNRVEFYNG